MNKTHGPADRRYGLYLTATIMSVIVASTSTSILVHWKAGSQWLTFMIVSPVSCMIAINMIKGLFIRRRYYVRNGLMKGAVRPYGDVKVTPPKRAARNLQGVKDPEDKPFGWF